MAEHEVTTTLGADATRAVVTEVLRRRRFRVTWDNAWSATAVRGFTRHDVTVFAPREGTTVVQVEPNTAGWFVVGGTIAGVFLHLATDRVMAALERALAEREDRARGAG